MDKQNKLGLLDFKPAVRPFVDSQVQQLIDLSNAQFPLESKHALTLLNSVITNPEERTDLLSYDTIYYYWVNGDPNTFNIPLRKRMEFLSV